MYQVERSVSIFCIDEHCTGKGSGVDEIIMVTPPGKDGKGNTDYTGGSKRGRSRCNL